MTELLDPGLFLSLFLLLNGLELEVLVVDLLDLFHVLDFLFSALSLFLLLLADSLFRLKPDELALFQLFSHLLNVFLLHFLVLFSDSFLEFF